MHLLNKFLFTTAILHLCLLLREETANIESFEKNKYVGSVNKEIYFCNKRNTEMDFIYCSTQKLFKKNRGSHLNPFFIFLLLHKIKNKSHRTVEICIWHFFVLSFAIILFSQKTGRNLLFVVSAYEVLALIYVLEKTKASKL